MEKSMKLKTCPFCGSVPHIEEFRGSYTISCEDPCCSANPFVDIPGYPEEEVIKQWNAPRCFSIDEVYSWALDCMEGSDEYVFTLMDKIVDAITEYRKATQHV